jgi:hypothetical protein
MEHLWRSSKARSIKRSREFCRLEDFLKHGLDGLPRLDGVALETNVEMLNQPASGNRHVLVDPSRSIISIKPSAAEILHVLHEMTVDFITLFLGDDSGDHGVALGHEMLHDLGEL